MNIFKSQDSRYTLKTAFLLTSVPLLMLGIIAYSTWLLLVINHSYFVASGLSLGEDSLETFFYHLLQSQIDYLPYLGGFFILVFFLGIFIAYITLRPFNQVSKICHDLIEYEESDEVISGLNRKKQIIRLGQFIKSYYAGSLRGRKVKFPDDLERVKTPTSDYVFYFQFASLVLILLGITIFFIMAFSTHIQESMVESALTLLKDQRRMDNFFRSQEGVYTLMTIVPSVVAFILYAVIAKVTISKIEGVTFGYLRDLRDFARGKVDKRLRPRATDPGQHTADAINQVLERLHPIMPEEASDSLEEPPELPEFIKSVETIKG